MSNSSMITSIKNEKQYLKLIIANIISRFGDSIDSIAYSWLVYKITDNPVWIAVIFGIFPIPNILFQPFAGVLVERFNKKKVMAYCDIGRGVIVSITALLYLLGMLNPILLMLFAFLNSTLESFRIPAGIAIMPRILRKENYDNCMAFSQTCSRISELAGLALAGGIIGLFGLHTAILIDGLSFILSAVAIFFIRYEDVRNREVKLNFDGFKYDLVEGFKYLRASKIVFLLCVVGSLLNFSVIPINTFQSIYVGDYLKLGPEVLSIFSFSMVGSMALGSIIAPKLFNKFKKYQIFISTGLSISIFVFLIAVASYLDNKFAVLTVMVTAFIFLGFICSIQSIIVNVSFVNNVSEEYMARIGGIFNAMAMAFMPIGSIFFAGLVNFMSIDIIFIVTAILNLAIYIPLIFSKVIRNL